MRIFDIQVLMNFDELIVLREFHKELEDKF